MAIRIKHYFAVHLVCSLRRWKLQRIRVCSALMTWFEQPEQIKQTSHIKVSKSEIMGGMKGQCSLGQACGELGMSFLNNVI